MDAMRGMRERAALRTLQRCFRQKKEAKAAIEAEKASEAAKEGVEALASSPDEAVKEGTEAATSSSSESVKEESAVDNSLPNVEVPLSPRVTERLNEARNLDAQLNS